MELTPAEPQPEANAAPTEANDATSETPANAALASPKLSFEEQLAQSPYAAPMVQEAPPAVPSEPSPVVPAYAAAPAPPPQVSPYAPPYSVPPPSPYAPQQPATAPPPVAAIPPIPPPPPSQVTPIGYTPPVYTQQPYTAYPPNYAAYSESASGSSILALVLGICSYFFVCPLIALPAAIIGFGEVRKIDRGESSRQGRGMALWGAWLGTINCIGALLMFLLWVFLLLVVGTSGHF
jgi:hypothetical protein